MVDSGLARASRPKVLVCDDEPVVRALVCAALEPRGYVLVEACDGDEAVALARTQQPDLIVLDMMMPGRSGGAVLAELRREGATAMTPVIVLTVRAEAAEREAVTRAGADYYVTKPFSPGKLSVLVDRVLAA